MTNAEMKIISKMHNISTSKIYRDIRNGFCKWPRKSSKSKHPLFRLYRGMIDRTHRPTDDRYYDYGGRGIKVCARWTNPANGFNNFVKDMGVRPKGYSIDRINNDGDYCPSNCKWSSAKEQAQNRRTRKLCMKSTTGVKGISKSGTRYRVRAFDKIAQKRIHIGMADTIEIAETMLLSFMSAQAE